MVRHMARGFVNGCGKMKGNDNYDGNKTKIILKIPNGQFSTILTSLEIATGSFTLGIFT